MSFEDSKILLRQCTPTSPVIWLTILKIFWVIETQNKNLFAVYLLNVCTQSLRQNEKWELLNDVCTNVSLELLILFVDKDLLLILIVLSAQ